MTENRIVKANELAEKFQVSMETIRRDLEQLEKEQIVRRVHGGAVLNVASGIEPDYSYREIKNYEQKIMIGKKAAELVKDGDTIIIDIGTTTLQMAKFLRGKSITVFTNSIKFAQELMDEEKVQLYLLGGKVRRGEGSTSGFMAEDHV
ncbi:MAG: DeoR/GlpR family DNA-binding transcription regulator, partial [Lachnospiraceae bacterium]